MPRTTDGEVALAAIGLLALAPAALVRSERVLCPIRRATGRPCPACGVTRSWHAVLRGRPAASLAFHPLAPAALGLVLAHVTGADDRPGALGERLRRPSILGAFAAAWTGLWLLRLRTGWTGR